MYSRQPSLAFVMRGIGVHETDFNVIGLKCGKFGVVRTISAK